MKSIPIAVIFALVSGPAPAQLAVRRLITFTPADGTAPFALCVADRDEGAAPPFQDIGEIDVLSGHQYTEARGSYELYNNQLLVALYFEENYIVTTLELTAETKNQKFKKLYNPKFTIFTFPAPPAHRARVTGPPVPASIVTTGSFAIASSCKKTDIDQH